MGWGYDRKMPDFIKSKTLQSVPIVLFLSMIPVYGVAKPSLNDSLGKQTQTCEPKSQSSKKHVWIFQQWHLSPSVNTQKNPEKKHPQQENQTAIYTQIDQWVSQGLIDLVLAEGCEGEINHQFSKVFNGWSMKGLKSKSKTPQFKEIISHVPMKLEAKYQAKLKTVCADDDSLIKKQNLALSDARGALGFLTRIDQYKNNPQKSKGYLEGVRDVYQLSSIPSPKTASQILIKKIRASIKGFKNIIHLRNKKAVEIIQTSKESEQVLVIGGIHAHGLVAQLEKLNMACTVVEPRGFRNDVGVLLKQLDSI